MATVRIPERNHTIDNAEEIAAFIAPFGMTYQRWPLEDRVSPDASADDILAAYAPEIEELKRRGGYVTADVIDVKPDTPGLDTMLNRFNKEHRHSEDEVRFIVKGSGLFHIHPDNGPVFSITVEAGDLITVPCGMRHWFDLCVERRIRAIRLFQDPSGWTPEYEANGAHDQFAPLCWGPNYISAAPEFKSTITG
ncbi:MAG: cupin domain-containing protein [Phycisphaerales bacterium]|nr:cupin domain-containing protein [Phycisphaerales bacterium]